MAPSRGRILIVDDEANARAALSEILHDEGYVTETAADGFKALGKIDEFAPDVVLTDLKMPGLDGIALMEKVKAASPLTVFVVMTAFGTITSAVAAMKNGADNYLTKPLDYEALSAVVERAMEKARLLQETRQLRDRLRDRNAFKHIITDDPKMKALLDVVAQVGPSKACVLVSGESGTGKELIAEAIAQASGRADKPLVEVSSLVPSLPEHWSDAAERAQDGTLLITDLERLDGYGQRDLLLLLTQLGQRPQSPSICATAQPELETAQRQGTFSRALYDRLAILRLDVPSLSERQEDLPELCRLLLHEHTLMHRPDRKPPELSDAALSLLQTHDWPGNVRELSNVLLRVVLWSTQDRIDVEQLLTILPQPPSKSELMVPIGTSLAEAERRLIVATLRSCDGNKQKAAAVLGITRRTLYQKLARYRLST